MEMKPISLITPSRNTLKYLKWAYTSIRKNMGYIHEICMADDFSTDGTWEWMKEIADKDINVKIHINFVKCFIYTNHPIKHFVPLS